MSGRKGSILMIIGRLLLLIALFLSVAVIVITGLDLFLIIMLSIVAGVIVWNIVGSKSIVLIDKLLIAPTKKIYGKNLFLLHSEKPPMGSILDRLFTAVDDSILPTLFLFGIFNYVLGTLGTLNAPIFNYLAVFSAPILGLIVPILKVMLDSDLVRFYPDKRLLEPVGRMYLLYLRSIAGYTAVVSLLITLIQVAKDIAWALISMAAVFALAYIQIFFTVLIYNFFHGKYVEKLNEKLRNEMEYLEIQYRELPMGIFGHVIKIAEEERPALEQ